MLIDAHCHLDYFSEEKLSEIISNARKTNTKIIVSNGTNPQSNRKVLQISEKYPEVKSALGIYPIDALSFSDEEIDEEIKFIKKNKNKIVAIGEVGIDLKESQDLEKQSKNFTKFVELSKEIKKPIIIHSRKAEKEVIEILEKEKASLVVMHCFCGNFNLVKKILGNNWKITIPTSVTRSEHFQKIIELAPIKNLLCETDSPYLHPQKLDNNEPSNVIWSYKKIAEIKKIPLAEVREQIAENYFSLFGKS